MRWNKEISLFHSTMDSLYGENINERINSANQSRILIKSLGFHRFALLWWITEIDYSISTSWFVLYLDFHSKYLPRVTRGIEKYVNSMLCVAEPVGAQWPRSIRLLSADHTRCVQNIYPVERSKFIGADNERRTLTKDPIWNLFGTQCIPSSLHKCILSLWNRGGSRSHERDFSNRVFSSPPSSLSLSLSRPFSSFSRFRSVPEQNLSRGVE